MPDVKSEPRSHRQRQALETRHLIARAARELFTEHGYAASSIEAVAAEAGVSPRTVYAIFGTKKAILGAICEEWLMEAGVMEAIGTGLADPDLARRLALVARTSRRQWELERGVRAMLEGAAASDADVARMLAGWKSDRASSFRLIVAGLENQLRNGIDGVRAAAIIRALSGGEVYAELVGAEGWSPADYESWLAGLLTDVLLPSR